MRLKQLKGIMQKVEKQWDKLSRFIKKHQHIFISLVLPVILHLLDAWLK